MIFVILKMKVFRLVSLDFNKFGVIYLVGFKAKMCRRFHYMITSGFQMRPKVGFGGLSSAHMGVEAPSRHGLGTASAYAPARPWSRGSCGRRRPATRGGGRA